MKQCKGCSVVKPLDDFGFFRRPGRKPVCYSRCKACQLARLRAWKEKMRIQDRDGFTAAERSRARGRLLQSRGISAAVYAQMESAQGGVCAICRQAQRQRNKHGGIDRLVIDHCHATGRVRGLLCHQCNKAIGLLKDDSSILRAAAEYLEVGVGEARPSNA